MLNKKQVSNRLNLALPNIEPISIPDLKDRKKRSLHWLAGFTDDEWCFFVA